MSIVNFNDGLGDVPTAYTEMFIKGSAENPQGPIYRLRVPRGRKVSEGLDAVRKRGYTPINDLPFDVALRLYKELE